MKLRLLTLLFSIMLGLAFTSCEKDPEDGGVPKLEVNPDELAFGTDGKPVKNDYFEIESNREWIIEVPSNSFVTLSQTEGEGDAKITVSVPEGESATAEIVVKIVTSTGSVLEEEEVTITRGDAIETDSIYEEDLGDDVDKVNNNWPYVDQFTGWEDDTQGRYTGNSASIRNSGKDYDPADGDDISGAPYVYLNSSANFEINDLTVGTEKSFTFKFAALNTVSTLSDSPYTPSFGEIKDGSFLLEVSPDGTKWYTATFKAVKAESSNWYFVTSEFKLPAAFNGEKFSIRFSKFSAGASLRLDDFELFVGGSGNEVEETPQAELPKVDLPMTTMDSFFDNFDDVTASNMIYESDEWGFFSNDIGWPANAHLGWKTGVYNTSDKYIQIAPYSSSMDQVEAYAVLAPINVNAATDKKLSLTRAWFYLNSADNSKLEVVASTSVTNENARESSTWTVLKDISFPADKAKNEWEAVEVDLSTTTFASSDKVYIALRYTGKSNTYRVDDVKFAKEPIITEPETTPITIPELLAMNKGDKVSETEHKTFNAIIVNDPEHKNYSNGSLYLMTVGATTKGHGIVLYNNSGWDASKYELGKEVKVTLKANTATIGEYNGVKQITNFDWADVVVTSEGSTGALGITINPAEMADYLSMPVLIENASVAAAGLWSDNGGNHIFTAEGVDFTVRVNSGATFKGDAYNATTGMIVGIVSMYNGKPQLLPRNIYDLDDFADKTPKIIGPTNEIFFLSKGGTQNIYLDVLNFEGNSISVSGLSGLLSASLNGSVVTVTAKENSKQNMSQTLKVSISGGNSIEIPVTLYNHTVRMETIEVTDNFLKDDGTPFEKGNPVDLLTRSDLKFEFDYSAASTDTRYWDDPSIRAYGKSNLVISGPSGAELERIIFNVDKIANISNTEGGFEGNTWWGPGHSAKFDFSATTKIYGITVLYSDK